MTRSTRVGAALAAEVTELLEQYPLRELVTRGEQYGVWVDRPLARFSAWYEMFPRSTGGWDAKGNPVHGTFATAAKALPRIAKMGFDVVYLPPIHPIGKVHRKGRNNSRDRRAQATSDRHGRSAATRAATTRSTRTRHHRRLRRLRRRRPRRRAWRWRWTWRCSARRTTRGPRQHPEWFTVLPDGTIAYAENPPKKYQDIYPMNFDNDPAGLYEEVLRVVRYWISHGVKVFRVDNPHTKPPELLGVADRRGRRTTIPTCCSCAEAFTRPARLYGLAKLGFTQSYTYFTWRTAKWELTEFGAADRRARRLRAAEPVRQHPRHPAREPAARRSRACSRSARCWPRR